MTLYIDSISKIIHKIVHRHRETFPRHERTFEDRAHFACWEGEAVSARARQARQ